MPPTARTIPLAAATTSPAAGSSSAGASSAPPVRAVHRVPAGMRDWLPREARRRSLVSQRLMRNLELFGYQRVSVPPFEYAAVWQDASHESGGHGGEADGVMRFVEPESGKVVALRSDVTPQIARLVTTRFAGGPWPARLCYQATVMRRRRERARLDRQVTQIGFELIGRDEVGGDLEVLEAATSGLRAAGLESFTVDLSHAQIAGALLSPVEAKRKADMLECLALKDSSRLEALAQGAGLPDFVTRAVVALPELYGGHDLWQRAAEVLAGTPAEGPLRSLQAIFNAATAAELAPRFVVDLGETRDFNYYTGAMFHLLAEGPGEPLGSGGRYDNLFQRFDANLPAAGFAYDVSNVCWALDSTGRTEALNAKVLVTRPLGTSSERTLAVLRHLRRLGISAARGPRGADPYAYAAGWDYSHILHLTDNGAELQQVMEVGPSSAPPRSVLSTGARAPLAAPPRDAGRRTAVNTVDPSEIANVVSTRLGC